MEETHFVAAETIAEASNRMMAITGLSKQKTKPPKRGLVALAKALDVDFNLTDTTGATAQLIAKKLEIPWRDGQDHIGEIVTLHGLNGLLRSASHLVAISATKPAIDTTQDLRYVYSAHPSFRPPKGKAEAVQRISDLTGSGPELLGPGSKERRSVLENLARGVGLQEFDKLTKHNLSRALLQRLGMPQWDTSFSTGETVTLEGLSLLLLGAERYFGVISSGWDLVEDEAEALLSALHQNLEPYFDGKKTISSMRANESRHWRENEWQGFYFEERAREILADRYPVPEVGGPKRKYGNTDFDYVSARRVWDMKAHSSTQIYLPSNYVPKPGVSMMLNDAQAMYDCIAEQGLGFIILNGQATYDETGQFDSWQRQFKSDGTGKPRTSWSNSNRNAMRKSGFKPEALTAVWIADKDELLSGFLGGWITFTRQGRQARRQGQTEGAFRRPKLSLRLADSTPWQISRKEF